MNDEKYYDAVLAEIRNGHLHEGLWLKALTKANRDQEKAKTIYIRLRVQQLKAEHTTETLKDIDQSMNQSIGEWRLKQSWLKRSPEEQAKLENEVKRMNPEFEIPKKLNFWQRIKHNLGL